MSYPVLGIAKKIIHYSQKYTEYGDVITNLKLQKLLYYIQGYHLAVFGTPLFEEEIEAWMYGPVIPDVYNYYKSFGANDLPYEDGDLAYPLLSNEEEELFQEVCEEYGKYSAYTLMHMTHEESPWKDTPKRGPGSVISKDAMQSFFRTQLA